MIFLKSLFSRILLLMLLSVLGAGCSPFKTMKEDQKLLDDQKIRGADKLSSSELSLLYKQKTNTRFLGLTPLIGAYNVGSSFYDSNKVKRKIESTTRKFDQKIADRQGDEKGVANLERRKEKKLEKLQDKLARGNFLMRSGEAPTVYDSSLIRQTTQLMKHQLARKGFFEGDVRSETDTAGRRVKVVYHVQEGPEFMIDELHYKFEDHRIDSLVRSRMEYTRLKKGTRYDEATLTSERDRLSQQLRNNGYYEFSSSYIYFNIDTTGKDKTKLKLQTVIKNPADSSAHPVYTIDSVYFFCNRNFTDSTRKFDTSTFHGIRYKVNENFKFSKKIADRKIKIHPGDIYSQRSVEATQRNLSMLDIFRTVSVRYEEDSSAKKLKAIIETNTLRKYALSGEFGVNVIQGLVPGPFGTLNFRERNTFKGFELFEISLRAAITGQAAVLDPGSVLRTEEYSAQASLSFPRIYFPVFNISKWDNYNPRTRFTGGYAIVRRPEYERATGKMSVVYSMGIDRHRTVNFSPVDINLVNTASISDSFENYLKYLLSRGNNLIYGFSKSYVSDINASYTFNNHELTRNRKSRNIFYSLESGGTLFNFYKTETFLGLNTFKYIKLNADLRYYFPLKEKSSLAIRFNIGAANPYGPNKVLPYEKYFFAGGPNSIRAWKLRRLGPGSYVQQDSIEDELSYRIEQPGELLLETSFEYRFNIIGFFDGALFADAGNVWMLTHDPARPGADFRINSFFNQIALGTGAGLRLNFSFLLIRFDLGIKAYDPAVKQFVLLKSGMKGAVLNFGIGYPF